MTILVETAKQVGRPKFLFPISEKAWPLSFLSFVHRITSHGAETGSASDKPWKPTLAKEDCLECAFRKAGELARGDLRGDGDRRDWKRRSNGGRGVAEPVRDLGKSSDRTSLWGEDRTEP